MLSYRDFDRAIWRCSQVECEDVIMSVDDVDVVAPRPVARETTPGLEFVQRVLRHSTGTTLALDPRPRPVRLEKDYELFFFLAQRPRDLALLKAVPGWRERCRFAICWIDEMWANEVGQARIVEPLEQFDHVLLHFGNTAAPLGERIGRPCSWLSLAIDMLRFNPWPNPPARTIDIYTMGRRAPETHRAVKDYAKRHGWFYLYDTVRPHSVYDSREHRDIMAETVKRARFFTANAAKVDVPRETGGQQETAQRFFEGAAGGAVLLGQPPRADTFTSTFDWPDAVVPLPYGSIDVAEIFDDLGHDAQRMARISRDNVFHCLRRHDWAHRWARILEMAGLPPTEALRRRLAHLTALSEQVRATSPVSTVVS